MCPHLPEEREYDIDSDVDDEPEGIVTKPDPHRDIEDLSAWAAANNRQAGGRFQSRRQMPVNEREGPMLPELPADREARLLGELGGEHD